MQEVVTRRAALYAAAAALAAVASGAAMAITLGEVEVRSALGEALDARIPVTAAPGDVLRGACFSLAPDAASAIPAVPGATLELRRSASGTRLQVRTPAPVSEPVLGLGIAVACPGSDAAAQRKEYSILLDPPRVARAAGAAAPTPAVATLDAQPGDTLESLARKIFPRERNARRAYLAAIRADNPALASLADTDPLPADAQVVLPDLRTFMKAAPAPRTDVAAESAAAPAPRTKTRVAERGTAASAPATLPSAREEAPALAAAQPPAPPRAGQAPSRTERTSRASASAGAGEPRAAFQLKLSAPVVDLSPTRSMNERQREELRARLALLDADDQTAAMLAMRDSIRRLETQVSELQLRLARAPSALAPPPEAVPAKPAPKVETTPAPKVESAPVPTKAESAPAPKVEPVAPEPQKAAKPEPEPAAAKAETSAKPASPAPATASTPTPPSPVHAIPRPAGATPWYESQWMWPGLLAGIALLLALWLVARRRAPAGDEEYYEEPEAESQTVMIAEDEPLPEREPLLPDDGVGIEPDRSVPAPLLATTRIPPEDTAELRRRYVEERFPETVNGTLVLSDPVSVVNTARQMREDRAATRAIELLQLAIEQNPRPPSQWLALFEVFRLERLRGEYAALAVRFMERFNGTLEWRKIRCVGRDLDPGNPLYEDTEPALAFDPAAENWLQPAPGGADAALAAELRGGLMAGAAVNEHDLVPDPTPALRKSESFNVA